MIPTARADVPDSEPTREHSYGIIPLFLTSPGPPSTKTTKILLIKQKTLFSIHPPFWSFPKGHAERGDNSTLHTAIREVQEETGLIVREEGILFGDGEPLIERYRNPFRGWVKEVRYWVGVVEGQGMADVVVQEAELVEARWCDWGEALELLAFERSKALLERVMKMLDGKEIEGVKAVEVEITAGARKLCGNL